MHRPVLVTAISGSGRSTAYRELKRGGYEAGGIEKSHSLSSMVHGKTGAAIGRLETEMGGDKTADCVLTAVLRFGRQNARYPSGLRHLCQTQGRPR